MPILRFDNVALTRRVKHHPVGPRRGHMLLAAGGVVGGSLVTQMVFQNVVGHKMAAAFTRHKIAFRHHALISKNNGVTRNVQAFRQLTAGRYRRAWRQMTGQYRGHQRLPDTPLQAEPRIADTVEKRLPHGRRNGRGRSRHSYYRKKQTTNAAKSDQRLRANPKALSTENGFLDGLKRLKSGKRRLPSLNRTQRRTMAQATKVC